MNRSSPRVDRFYMYPVAICRSRHHRSRNPQHLNPGVYPIRLSVRQLHQCGRLSGAQTRIPSQTFITLSPLPASNPSMGQHPGIKLDGTSRTLS